jgi:hypothetical protein
MSQKLVTTRRITTSECPWLDADLEAGTPVTRFVGCTYGCISENGTAVTFDDYGPFYKLPDDALEPATNETTIDTLSIADLMVVEANNLERIAGMDSITAEQRENILKAAGILRVQREPELNEPAIDVAIQEQLAATA